MDTANIKKTKEFVREFLEEYLADGLGTMPKREVDILIMNLLMKYGGLAEKSNQELSILLRAPVSRIKGLRYEARLKYPPEAEYVQREFLYILTRSHFDFDRGKIVFAIEDEFLRQAIQGRLKAKGMFADTSFNTELVKIDETSLKAVISELYGVDTAQSFQDGFDAMKEQLEGGKSDPAAAFTQTIIEFAVETAKKLAFEFVRSRIGF